MAGVVSAVTPARAHFRSTRHKENPLKTRHLSMLLLCATLASAHAAPPPRSAPVSGGEAPPARVLGMADRCTDFTTNGWAFKSPRNFLQWLDVFSTPDIHLEFARRAMDPRQAVRTMTSLIDPGTPRNYLEWTNPEIYTEWLRSAFDPEFQQAVGSLLFDPDRILRWAALPGDPRAWNLLASAFDPITLGNWLAAPGDPSTRALLEKAADPATFERWTRELTNPDNYAGLTTWLEQAY